MRILIAEDEAATAKALGRRSEHYADSLQTAGNLVLDGNRYVMRVGEHSVSLPNKEHFSLSNAAWEIVEVYQPQAKARGKKLDVSIQEDVDLYGEKAAVQQMLSVLLDNAIRYSDPEGEIRFSILKKRNRTLIEVFNTCQYDTPPDVKRLFDRFYRPDSSRSTETGGTGVGLAIAKAVAETHGGSISASCPSGKTMTIKVIL